mgnify:CR=1 FL=1
MSMFLITLPIFLIVAAGWLMRKFNIVKESWISVLNGFAYYVSLPALIIASFWDINFLDKKSLEIILWSLLAVSAFSLIIFLLLSIFKIKNDLKAAIFLSATVGNTIYMGFPLVSMVFGENYLSKGVLIGVIYLVIPLLISIFAIRYWHSNDHSLSRQLKDFFKNPLMVSVCAGIVLSFVNFDIAAINSVKKSFAMLGATASPVALFTLGEFLYGKFLKKNLELVFFVSSLKLVLFPLAVIFISFYFFKRVDFKVLTLLSSMPVAVTTFVIAEKFHLNKDLVGNSIFISTVLSFLIIPLILFLF